jgi:hypothetical protein
MEKGSMTIIGELQNWLEDYAPADQIERCAASLQSYLDTKVLEGRIDEAKYIFALLWDEDGAPFQRDDPPREILDRISALKSNHQESETL